MSSRDDDITFGELDRKRAIRDVNDSGKDFPIPTWYREIRDIPVRALGIGDICRSLRQQIYLEHTIPAAINMLQQDPLSGELYEGELLASLNSVERRFWLEHSSLVATLRPLIETALRHIQSSDSEDIAEEARRLLNKM